MSEKQTIDETLSRNLKQILRKDDLLKIALETSYSLEFVGLLLSGGHSLSREDRVILKVAKHIARGRMLRFG